MKSVPLPKRDQKETAAKTFNYENKTMKFEENKRFRQLKPSKHCIFSNNSKLIKSKELGIILLNEKLSQLKIQSICLLIQ